MTDFDKKLEQLLSEEDEAFVTDAIDETGYYKTVLSSFSGQGSALRVFTWIGILVWGAMLIYCVWKFFQVDTTRDQILFAAGAIMLNSAQIALKLWFNMQLNRRVLSHEIKRLQVMVAKLTAPETT